VTLELRDADDSNNIVPSTRIAGVPTVVITTGVGTTAPIGTIWASSVPLTASSVTFFEAYTAPGTLSLRATVTIGTTVVTGQSALMTVNPGPYVRVLAIYPGETALTAPNASSTGKSGTRSTRTLNTAFPITVRAVDAYWNLVTASTGVARVASTPSGLVSGTLTQAFSGGVANFSVAVTTPYFNLPITVDDSGIAGITSETSTITVTGSYYFNIIVPSSATAGGPATFPVTLELRDQSSGNLVGPNAIPSPNSLLGSWNLV
jgi:hypothetical protein